jgi:hypothetical protein
MSAPSFAAFMLSCADRAAIRASTLESLRRSGWRAEPDLIIDDGSSEDRLERIHRTWRRVIRRAAAASSEFVLLLEDDVHFGNWFAENLRQWPLLARVQPGGAFFASLYNPGRPYVRRSAREHYLVAYPEALWGAQAIVMTPPTARFIDSHWDEVDGNPDQKMPRLAARVTPLYLYLPSLVDHAPVPTTWGGIEHRAADFDPDFRACPAQPG